jgi:hypothetical protein
MNKVHKDELSWFINQEKPSFINEELPPLKNGVCCLYELCS